MDKSSRNIAALALLAVLLAIMGAAVAWYLFVGHNWNHAATHIDERVGDMQGYRVVLIDGVSTPASEALPAKPESTRTKRGTDAVVPSEDGVAGGEASAGTSESSAEAVAVADAADGAKDSRASKEPITAEQVALDYRLKGATVVMLDVGDLSAYDRPAVVTRNGYWVGAFALEGANERIAARRAVLNLRDRDADFVVAFTKDVRILNQHETARAIVDGVNMIVYAGNAELPDEGVYRGSALVVDEPKPGEVQAVIISPSNVVSSKTISEIGQ